MISYTCYFTYMFPMWYIEGLINQLQNLAQNLFEWCSVFSCQAERKFMYKFMCPSYRCPVLLADWWLDIIEKDSRLYNAIGKHSGFNSQTNPSTKLIRAQEWKILSLTHKSCLFVQPSVLIWWKPADRTKGGAVNSSEWLRTPPPPSPVLIMVIETKQRHSSILFMSTKCYDHVLFRRD